MRAAISSLTLLGSIVASALAPAPARAAPLLVPIEGHGLRNEAVLSRAGRMVELRVNGVRTFAAPYDRIESLVVVGSPEDDTLRVDLSGDMPVPAGGLSFVGGEQWTATGDVLEVVGGNAVRQLHSPTGPSDGTLTLVADGREYTIAYSEIEPITDTALAVDYTFNDFGTSGYADVEPDSFNGNSGLEFLDPAASPQFETTQIANKSNVTFNAENPTLVTVLAGSGPIPSNVPVTLNNVATAVPLSQLAFASGLAAEGHGTRLDGTASAVYSLFSSSPVSSTNPLLYTGFAGQPSGVTFYVDTLAVTAPTPALVGKSSSLSGTFTDATDYAAADFTATINWGDGSPPLAVSLPASAGAGGAVALSGTHTYTAVGQYTVTLSATDTISGLSKSVTTTEVVTAQTLDLSVSPTAFPTGTSAAALVIVSNPGGLLAGAPAPTFSGGEQFEITLSSGAGTNLSLGTATIGLDDDLGGDLAALGLSASLNNGNLVVTVANPGTFPVDTSFAVPVQFDAKRTQGPGAFRLASVPSGFSAGGPAVVGIVSFPTGPAGPAGPAGPTGPAGLEGSPGAAGAAGLSGPQGSMGPTGAQGPTGPAGQTGRPGPAGATGATGAAGPAGPAGVAGAVGVPGAAGAIGATGPTGAAGAPGQTGLEGPMGVAGAEGPMGTPGANGAPGIAGATGATGATGAAGPVSPSATPGKASCSTSPGGANPTLWVGIVGLLALHRRNRRRRRETSPAASGR